MDWKASGFQTYFFTSKCCNRIICRLTTLEQRPENSATYGPFILALLIFLSACLNFSNTTVSHANRRLKEIGMRKVMGSSHRQLVIQLLLECCFIVCLAVLLSVLLNQVLAPDIQSNVQCALTLLQIILMILICSSLLAVPYY